MSHPGLEKIAGMNSHYRFYSIDYFFESLVENKMDYFELWTATHHFSISDHGYQNTVDFRKKLRHYGLELICLTPEQSNPKPYSMAASERFLKDKARRYFENVILVASELECPLVGLNPGWAFYSDNRDKAWQQSVESMKHLAEFGANHGVELVIEALQPEESCLVNTLTDLERYVRDIQHQNVSVTVDLGAMARQNETIDDYFKIFGSRIRHCHFVDGNPTGHLAWGEGERKPLMDIKQFMERGYQGHFSFEFAQSRYYKNPRTVDKRALEYIRKGEWK